MSGRDDVVDWMRAQLVGPVGGATEQMKDRPQDRYLMGVLYPQESKVEEALEDDTFDELPGGLDGSVNDPVALANQFMPSSCGVSFFLAKADSVSCIVHGARYEGIDRSSQGRFRAWRRIPLASPEDPLVVELHPDEASTRIFDERARLHSTWRPRGEGWIVTVTLINERGHSGEIDPEEVLFQVGLECRAPAGEFRAYPDPMLATSDPEEEELRLRFRKQRAFAMGHGCSAAWGPESNGAAEWVGVEFIPTFDVPALTADIGGSEVLSAARLADLSIDDETLIAELREFVDRYGTWIGGLRDEHSDIPNVLEPAADRILGRLGDAFERIGAGIDVLEQHADVMESFRHAQLVMVMQRLHSGDRFAGSLRAVDDEPEPIPDYLAESTFRWRPFQLAFQLLVLPGVAERGPNADDRDLVDLLWFPTGGGKTEAYFAVAALQIFLRRRSLGPEGGGTAVITRYTLRLLTTQQFQRTATFICACELLRRQHPQIYGGDDAPISIGLWTGKGAGAQNTLKDAKDELDALLDDPEPKSPYQLSGCAWCGTRLVPAIAGSAGEFGYIAERQQFTVRCPSGNCEFHEHMPVAWVDEEMYLRPPTFLVATVDKFAQVPKSHQAGIFLGAGRFAPPSLVIQDELHLLSGPLGTTVGIYERAFDVLMRARGGRPKTVASTATIRRADDQVHALFDAKVQVFPPPGLDDADSYFARIDAEAPGRRYVGVMGQSHTPSTAVVHVSAVLAQAGVEIALDELESDGYWTIVAYHNSLRELGKTITFARDDIPARIQVITSEGAQPRTMDDQAVLELTSNVSGQLLRSTLDRIETVRGDVDAVDFLACTNMLSVGVDIPRLGLMLMNGQPKTTAEYIQATSRVGRGSVPGLVVTLYSATKPRDRSHYESFVPYHRALYRFVEPTSVTPFAQPSRDRSLHAALVTLLRHGTEWSRNEDASTINLDDSKVADLVERLIESAGRVDADEMDATRAHLHALLATWKHRSAHELSLHYQAAGKQSPALMRRFGEAKEGWATLDSMRNIDQQCSMKILGEKSDR